MKRFNLRHQCALGALAGAMAFAPSAASAQATAPTEQDTDLVAGADAQAVARRDLIESALTLRAVGHEF